MTERCSPRLPRRARRDALRALRGRVLRTELYALDGTAARGPALHRDRVASTACARIDPPAGDDRPRSASSSRSPSAQRTTQWERGDDPMTQFAFTGDYDAYGQPRRQIAVAVPRGRDPRALAGPPAEPYLATHDATEYAPAATTPALHASTGSRARPTLRGRATTAARSVFELRDARARAAPADAAR